jgi:hypothetical protein
VPGVVIAAALRRARRRLRDQRGFAIMELLVSCLIGTIVLMVVLDLVDTSLEASSRVESRVDGTQRGRSAVEQVLQRLRSQTCVQLDDGSGSHNQAPPIVYGDQNEVSFYADLGSDSDAAPELRRLYVVGNDLREDVTDGVETANGWTFPTQDPALNRTRTLLDGVKPSKDAAGVTRPYFRYYAYDTAALAEPTVLLNTPLTAADIAQVVKVQFAFRAQPIGARDEMSDTDFENSVITRFANPGASDPTRRGPICE